MEIAYIQEKVAPIMAKYGIKRAAVFGSVSRGENRLDSDIDLLVKLGDQPMGMFRYMQFIDEVEKTLGRKVDLVTEGADKFLRPYILKDTKVIYEG
jgi:predicted nucleotidyltransferase